MSIQRTLSPPPRPARPVSYSYVPRSSPLAASSEAQPDDVLKPKTRTGATPSRISPSALYPTPPRTPSPNSSKSELAPPAPAVPEPSVTSILITPPTPQPSPQPSLRTSPTRRPRSAFSAPPVFKAYSYSTPSPSQHHVHVRWSDDTANPPPHRRASTSSPDLSTRRNTPYVQRPIYGNIPRKTGSTSPSPPSENNWLTATAPPRFSRAWTSGVVMPVKTPISDAKPLRLSTSTGVLAETAAFNTKVKDVPQAVKHPRRASEGDVPPARAKRASFLGRKASSLRETVTVEEDEGDETKVDVILDTKSEMGMSDTMSIMSVGSKSLKQKMAKWKTFFVPTRLRGVSE
ncbi:hypothetical protein M422DRAFT_41259 [Sphaerobolus stellatus SS14]|nr:hypothetical protein M422DRAFT_41259 [Sphaerobolus stellatus SS14]